jgi:NAD(P)-dependent dehydrogenase (short-subunit alcohol dehydrogenase family)
MSDSLRGKTALITGGAKRIGRECALALAADGCHVLVHHRHSAEEAEALCAEIRLHGVQAWAIAADFAQPSEYETLFARALELAGTVDILLNNASIFPQDTPDTTRFEDWVATLQVNTWVPFLLGRELYRRVGHGKIVNLLDARLKGYDCNHVSYMLSKQALELLTRMMALALAPQVSVNAVGPGLILPPPGQSPDYLARLQDTVPMQAHGGPQDIAEAMLFLLHSAYITGDTIYVDGGRHLQEYQGNR